MPARDADEYERLIPDARKIVFDDTGHSPMMERPQTFNDCLVEFLAEERRRAAERGSSSRSRSARAASSRSAPARRRAA